MLALITPQNAGKTNYPTSSERTRKNAVLATIIHLTKCVILWSYLGGNSREPEHPEVTLSAIEGNRKCFIVFERFDTEVNLKKIIKQMNNINTYNLNTPNSKINVI